MRPHDDPTVVHLERWSDLFVSGPVVFVRWRNDEAWTVVDVSPNVEAVFGYSAAELTREPFPWAKLVVEADLPGLVTRVTEFLDSDPTAHTTNTYRLIHRDGQPRTVLEHTQVERDEHDDVVGIRGYVIDVTQAANDSEALQRSMAELEHVRSLLEETSSIARIGAWEVQLADGSLFHSRVTREIHEVPMDRTLSVAEALTYYPVEGGHRQRLGRSVEHAMQTGEGFDIEVQFVTATQRTLWVRVRGQAEIRNGVPTRLLGSIQDIDDRKRTELALQESNALWQFAMEGAGDGVWDWDPRTDRIFYSNRTCEMLGYTPDEITPSMGAWYSVLHPDDRDRLAQIVDGMRSGRMETAQTVQRLRHRQGYWLWFLCRAKIMERDADGETTRVIGTNTDITRQKLDDEARYRRLVNQLQEVVFRTDHELRWTFLNPAWQRLTGHPIDQTLVHPLVDSIHPDDREHVERALEGLFVDSPEPTVRLECRIVARRGPVRWVEMLVSRESGGNDVGSAPTSRTGLFGSLVDITPRKERDERIERLAFYDPLTSLPNRRLITERLARAADPTATPDRASWGALLLLDLDNFKNLNDTRGHDVGDELLVEVGRRLLRTAPAHGLIARLGGDEFVLFLEGLADTEPEARVLAERHAQELCDALRVPFPLEYRNRHGEQVTRLAHVTVSVGITVFDAGVDLSRDLMKEADLALYEAKRVGRNTFTFFHPALLRELDERMSLADDLRGAIHRDELWVAVQGQFTREGALCGAEALLRWEHPVRGTIAPCDFIPVAEESGQIVEIGRWMLEQVTRRLRSWATHPKLRDLVVAVNVSTREFRESDFLSHVEWLLRQGGFPPQNLQMELTESLMAEDVDSLVRTMETLRSLGITFSIDDFGTGYSSLAYLKRLPLSQLKIDQSFVRDVTDDRNDRAIVRTIIAMGDSLDLRVIAEGVETTEQLRVLTELGCPSFQGWLTHRPCTFDEFQTFIEERGSQADTPP